MHAVVHRRVDAAPRLRDEADAGLEVGRVGELEATGVEVVIA